jgi:hypothetical protein
LERLFAFYTVLLGLRVFFNCNKTNGLFFIVDY